MIKDNVIHFDIPTWYCMRQCRESINYLSKLRDPIYQVEINGEKDILRHFMKEVLSPANDNEQVTQREAA